MKIGIGLLVWLLAAAYAQASGSDAQNQQAVGFLPMASERLSNVSAPGYVVPKPNKTRREPMLRANFSSAKAGVIDDVGATSTSTFAHPEAANTATPDQRLIVLAALGLIVLQLQRKHKSLLRRRITPSS